MMVCMFDLIGFKKCLRYIAHVKIANPKPILTFHIVAPSSVKPYVSMATPYILSIVRGVEMLTPYMFKLYQLFQYYATLMEPYKLDLLVGNFFVFAHTHTNKYIVSKSC